MCELNVRVEVCTTEHRGTRHLGFPLNAESPTSTGAWGSPTSGDQPRVLMRLSPGARRSQRLPPGLGLLSEALPCPAVAHAVGEPGRAVAAAT